METNLWKTLEEERDKYYVTKRSVSYENPYVYRVEYAYMYFNEDDMGEDEFYQTGDFDTLQQALEFKELLEKVKDLDVPRLDEDTYLVGDIKIFKVIFETRELIM